LKHRGAAALSDKDNRDARGFDGAKQRVSEYLTANISHINRVQAYQHLGERM
jgi:hypothetical protein